MNESEYANHERNDAVLAELHLLRQTLNSANRTGGGLARFQEIKSEIEDIGWAGVCELYHPDINVRDPAAHALFALYKFVYTNIDKL